jgi:hypothetical protein
MDSGAYKFLSSLAVAYLSSVVMLSSWPALIGMSISPGVFPVRISGPFYDIVNSACTQSSKGKFAYRVKGNCQWTSSHFDLRLSGMVDNGLMILLIESLDASLNMYIFVGNWSGITS